MSAAEPDVQTIPARRLAAKDHLARAAKAAVASDAERYHLQAAIGEALLSIAVVLAEELPLPRQIRSAADNLVVTLDDVRAALDRIAPRQEGHR